MSPPFYPPSQVSHAAEFDGLTIAMLVVCLGGLLLVHGWLMVAFLRRGSRRTPQRNNLTLKVPSPLEWFWTMVPAVLLIGLTLIGQRTWLDYRSPNLNAPLPILVIGQQYQWNFIYPGPDRTLGSYLRYPSPTDPLWPATVGGKAVKFAGVPGPAHLPAAQAASAISDYIEQLNPLGQDHASPGAADDNLSRIPGRPLELPADTNIELLLGSKDVVHALAIPALRLKMDALPGHTTRLRFRTPAVTAPQTLELMCMEFCGLGHSAMRADVILLPAEQWHAKYSAANTASAKTTAAEVR